MAWSKKCLLSKFNLQYSKITYDDMSKIRGTSAFIKFAKDWKRKAKHLVFAEEVNEIVYESLFEKINSYDKIGILGLSFKPNSPIVIGSPSLKLIDKLLKYDKTINGYDVIKETYDNLERNIYLYEDAQECVNKSDVVVIMHPDTSFKSLDFSNKKNCR